VESSGPSGDRSLQEALRAAVERTLAATAGSASETRGRAQELLDDVARRGQEARDTVGRRGQEAREASASVTTRVVEAIQEMRLASGEEVRALAAKLAAIERRVSDLEQRSRDDPGPDPAPQVEGK
jgi:polyhydroxyalkanoate synthesis regulator phasin